MENVKTYSDMINDKELDAKALVLFNELYEKINNLSDKEMRYIRESVCSNDMSDVESINTEMEKVQNEGLVGGIFGGITGLAFGKKIGAAVCKALGITTGPLYNLLNSTLVQTAICTYLGVKM
jgi:hypothetical protein